MFYKSSQVLVIYLKSLHLFKFCGFKLEHQRNDKNLNVYYKQLMDDNSISVTSVCVVWSIALNILFFLVFYFLWLHDVIIFTHHMFVRTSIELLSFKQAHLSIYMQDSILQLFVNSRACIWISDVNVFIAAGR